MNKVERTLIENHDTLGITPAIANPRPANVPEQNQVQTYMVLLDLVQSTAGFICPSLSSRSKTASRFTQLWRLVHNWHSCQTSSTASGLRL